VSGANDCINAHCFKETFLWDYAEMLRKV